MSKLLNAIVHGEIYNYINYETEDKSKPQTSVDGLIIKVTSENKEQLISATGFYRDLIKPLIEDENNSINQIVILSVTTKGMAKLTGFFFDNGEDKMELSLTREPNIVKYYQSYIADKNVQSENINTLEFLANEINPNKNFFNILKYYYSPTSVEDIGFEIDGIPLKYGQTVIINNVQSLVNKHENLKGGKLDILDVDKIELKIYEDGPKLMSSIGKGLLYDQNGDIITSLKYYCIEEIEGDYAEFEKQCQLKDLHIFALRANEDINKRPHKKESIIADCIQRYEREMEENSKPHYETIGVGFLLESINENLVTIK